MGLKIWSVRTAFLYQLTILCKCNHSFFSSMFELLWQLGSYTESMLTTDILHQLSSKYNMHPGFYNATSWEMSEIHCWQDCKFKKSLLLLLYIEISLQIYKKYITHKVCAWVCFTCLFDYAALHIGLNFQTSAQNSGIYMVKY